MSSKDLERRVGELEAMDGTRLRQILSLEGRVSALDGVGLGTDPLDGAKRCVVTELRCGMGELHGRLDKLEDAKVSHDHLIGSWSTRLGDVLSQVTNLEREMARILERVGHLESRMETVDGFHIVGEEPAFYKRLNALENEMAMIRAAVGSVQDPLNPMPLVDIVLSLNRRLEWISPNLERMSALEAQVKDMDEALGDLRRLSPVTVGSAVMLHDKQISGLKERVEAIMRSVESMQPKTLSQVMCDSSNAEQVDKRQREFSWHLAEAKARFEDGKFYVALSNVIAALELFAVPGAPEITQDEAFMSAFRCGKTEANCSEYIERVKRAVKRDYESEMQSEHDESGPAIQVHEKGVADEERGPLTLQAERYLNWAARQPEFGLKLGLMLAEMEGFDTLASYRARKKLDEAKA